MEKSHLAQPGVAKYAPAPAGPLRKDEAEYVEHSHFFTASGGTYGSPRITLGLWAEGRQVSGNTVAKLMAELGLQGRMSPRRRRSLTRQGRRKAASDLVGRRFDAVARTCCGSAT